MTPRNPEDPDAFEVVESAGAQRRVAKTPYGWFPVTEFAPASDSVGLSFSIVREVPPSAADLRIVQRALEWLKDEAAWDRHDSRSCVPAAVAVSLFCALERSVVEVVGRFHYRQPALQIVRQVVGEVGKGRVQKHRLMDYNNHPNTSLSDIRAVLTTATARMAAALPKDH